tara:strand:- start:10206 stop:11363 length:1158 start_codon:yes stop_codon:yes gene_type:complete
MANSPDGGLIDQTNAQYYSGQEVFFGDGTNKIFTSTFKVELLATTATTNANFQIQITPVNGSVFIESNYTVTNNVITFTTAPANGAEVLLQLQDPTLWEGRGNYEYVKISDIVDNFMVAYVGTDKVIPRIKRSDVIFHAKRGLQEFSYDTLKSIKSQELSLPSSLQLPIPQDYVNYTRLSWVDPNGVQRTIYPANGLTMNPDQLILQDNIGGYIQDQFGENQEASQSLTDRLWKNNNDSNINGKLTQEVINNSNIYNLTWWKQAYGQRYGLEPELTQTNGWFTINEREGTFSFSSNISGIILIEYISDGLAYNADTRIPKMIEQAMYMHIVHAVVSTARNMPEYVIGRFKKERRAALRNAKIRLQNLKLDELTQVMRGKSKWIKY